MRRTEMLIGAALILVSSPLGAQTKVSAQDPSPEMPLKRDDWAFGIDANVGPLPGVGPDQVLAGLAGRAGYRWDSGRAYVTPEGILGLMINSGTRETDASPPELEGYVTEIAWIGAGLRGGLRFFRIEPGAFAHAYILYRGIGEFALDLGGVLDIRITRSVAVGAHAAYTFVPRSESDSEFGLIGLHVDLMR